MIHFFRKIRRQLLGERSFSKYVVYALGEILLVMIGILLALQVNNWNDRRLEGFREQMILKNLQSDFQTNINEVNYSYRSTLEAYEASVDLLEIVKDDGAIDPAEVEQLIDDIINKIKSLDLLSGSVDEIFNNGSLHILQDVELRRQLSNWSFFIADTNDDVKIYSDYLFGFFVLSLTEKVVLRNTSVPSFFRDDLGLREISKSDFTMDYELTLRTVQFENELYNNTLNYMYALNDYRMLEDYFQETLKLIEANIK